jgi:hypothetical protein
LALAVKLSEGHSGLQSIQNHILLNLPFRCHNPHLQGRPAVPVFKQSFFQRIINFLGDDPFAPRIPSRLKNVAGFFVSFSAIIDLSPTQE